MEPDAAAVLDDSGSDFEELESDGSGLGRTQLGSLEMAAQEPEQTVGRGIQQEAEPIDAKTMATELVGFKIGLQFLDPVFRPTSHYFCFGIGQLTPK